MSDLRHLPRILAFLREIGLAVREGPIGRESLVAGVDIVAGGLLVDGPAMCAPADVLHEAAHIALMPRERWASLDGTIDSTPADELTAIAWTWAAATFLGIEPAEVFHEEVISGNGPTLLENFREGRYVGVPMLQRWGMAFSEKTASEMGVAPYPHMLRWLRD